MLAVFPLDTDRACERALDAAIEARAAMWLWNAERRERGDEVLNFGIALHAGDWVHADTVAGFQAEARRSLVVHGNSDPVELRKSLPQREVFEVDNVRLGLIHPYWGREEFPSERLFPDFPEEEVGKLDVICFGHFHVPLDEVVDGVRFVNAGQGYPSFLVPGTLAWIRVSGSEVTVEIEEFAPAD